MGGGLTLRIVPHDFLVTLVLSRVWMSGEVLFQLESIQWFIVYQDPGIEMKGRRTNSLPLCVPCYPLSCMRKQRLRRAQWLPQGVQLRRGPSGPWLQACGPQIQFCFPFPAILRLFFPGDPCIHNLWSQPPLIWKSTLTHTRGSHTKPSKPAAKRLGRRMYMG